MCHTGVNSKQWSQPRGQLKGEEWSVGEIDGVEFAGGVPVMGLSGIEGRLGVVVSDTVGVHVHGVIGKASAGSWYQAIIRVSRNMS